MINFNYRKEDNIIYVKRQGEINFDDLLLYIGDMDEKIPLLKELYILDDFRESRPKFTASEYPKLVEEIKKRVKKYTKVQHAVIVNNPSNTVLSVIFEGLSVIIDKYAFKTFSTPEAGKFWLWQKHGV